MKQLEQRARSVRVKAERDEVARIKAIEDFERLHFPAWLDGMASATGLQPGDILAVLHYATFEGLVSDLTVFSNTSLQYKKHNRWLGRTPIEIAAEMFVSDHWRPGVSLPERPISWNLRRAELRANTIVETYRVMNMREKAQKV